VALTYRYIKLPGEEKRYFCIQQNMFSLVWTLFLGTNTLMPSKDSSADPKSSGRFILECIRQYYFFLKSNLRKTIHFIRCKLGVRKIIASVDLPIYGQTCVLVNKGHKIFDQRQKLAIKIYRNDVDEMLIRKELKRIAIGSHFKFGVLLKRVNIEERYYQEEYVKGDLDYSPIPIRLEKLLEKFVKDIVPCLFKMMLYEEPMLVNLYCYINKLQENLEKQNLKSKSIDDHNIEKVVRFISSIKEKFNYKQNTSIFIAFSHGDFCPANMLNTKEGLRVLDWESAFMRSVFFDFYSYFFFRALHQKHLLFDLMLEINLAVQVYLSRIKIKCPMVAEVVKTNIKLYRWIFYIERIYMMVDRVMYDTKLDVKKNISRYIDTFIAFEKLADEYFIQN
jgi:thiamine kinase-like enzyme